MLWLFPGLSGGRGAGSDSRDKALPLSLQTPGMPVPQYPYGEGNAGITAQGPPPQPRPPEDTWAPPTAYGVQPRYGWHTAPVPGNSCVSESHPPWAASGAPAHPPAWDPKVGACAAVRPPQLPSNPSSVSWEWSFHQAELAQVGSKQQVSR